MSEMTPEHKAIAAKNKAHNDAARLDSANNPELDACVGNCKINNDATSPQAQTALALDAIAKGLKIDYKAVGADGTMTEDHKMLLQADIVDTAEKKFNDTLDNHAAKLITEGNALVGELFTEKYTLDPADISMLGNSSVTDMMINDFDKYVDNKACASIIAHLSKKGFYSDTLGMSDRLNRRHSAEVYQRLQDIETEGQMLQRIKVNQAKSVGIIRPNPQKVQKIRANQFKRK